MILENIRDSRTFFACGLTCKVLAARAKRTQEDLIRPYGTLRENYYEYLDMYRLRRHLSTVPLVGHFLKEASIPAQSIPKFACEFSGKLPGLRKLHIGGTKDAISLLRRTPSLAALPRFRGVVELILVDVVFWSFADLARLVCAFPSLVRLILDRVTWQRGEGRSLACEPYARSLNLHDIQVCTSFVRCYVRLCDNSRLGY
ncbi:hypothetical protein OBBRIDRAFT_201243 [Obba rivulosa]|uniref:Uncharacterized protein n=1 Tax=Obba rivulosa TaxID=1052685 RepID=A0A8E2AP51_9APHY|nr:hypothetical protein OBBRIDRAFT_201243 [Obba rivulosa]